VLVRKLSYEQAANVPYDCAEYFQLEFESVPSESSVVNFVKEAAIYLDVAFCRYISNLVYDGVNFTLGSDASSGSGTHFLFSIIYPATNADVAAAGQARIVLGPGAIGDGRSLTEARSVYALFDLMQERFDALAAAASTSLDGEDLQPQLSSSSSASSSSPSSFSMALRSTPPIFSQSFDDELSEFHKFVNVSALSDVIVAALIGYLSDRANGAKAVGDAMAAERNNLNVGKILDKMEMMTCVQHWYGIVSM